mgnify:CR=1 FL=1
MEREPLVGDIQEYSGWRSLWARFQRMRWIYKLALLGGLVLLVVVIVLAVALPGNVHLLFLRRTTSRSPSSVFAFQICLSSP